MGRRRYLKYLGAGVVAAAAAGTAAYFLYPGFRPAAKVELHVIGEALPPLEALGRIKVEYEKEHPDVSIVVEGYEYEALLEKTSADFAAKTGKYDCVMGIYFELGKYVENGWVYPLSDFLEKPELIDPAVDFEDIITDLWHTMAWYKDECYGFNFSSQTEFIWYRHDLWMHPEERDNFKSQYGYDLPLRHPEVPCGTPQFYDAWRDASEFFCRKKGEKLAGKTLEHDFFGTCIQAKRHPCTWYEYWCYAPGFGADAFKVIDGKEYVTLNGSEALEALEYYKSMVEFSPPGVLEYTWDDALIAMQQDIIAQCVMWYDASFAVEDPAMSKVAGLAAYHAPIPCKHGLEGPELRNHKQGGWGFYINKHTRWPEEAFKFIQWTARPDIQIMWAKEGGLPFTKSSYEHTDVWSLPMVPAAYYGNMHQYTWPKEPWAYESVDKTAYVISQALTGTWECDYALDWLADEVSKISKRPVYEYLTK